MRIHLKVWLEENGQVLFGEGRQQLLEAVHATKSLAGAARQLGMSYRAAWGRVQASEKRLGFKLVQRSDQGRRAMQLTPQGQELMERYQALRERFEVLRRQAEKELISKMGRRKG